MKRRVEVHVDEAARRVGTLTFSHEGSRERASFAYAPEWNAAADAFAIDPALPLVEGQQFKRVVRGGSVFHGVIADTEPDGWARNVILRDQQKRRQAARDSDAAVPPVETALDFLLAVDDTSRVGALRYRDESGVFRRATEPGSPTAPPLIELADLVRSTRRVEEHAETTRDLEYLRGRGTSVNGLRPKCTLRDNDGALAIGKFPSVSDTRAVTKAEVLTLTLADRAGINAASARLVDSDGVPVAVIRRFDRDGAKRRLYVSAATLMGVGREDTGPHTYTGIVDVIRQTSPAPQADIEELWRRVAFSILVNNVDDHLWNHGFLHVEHSLWRLSPAFDVNPFPDRQRELKTWISEEAGPAASIENLRSVAPYFRLSAAKARDILKSVEAAVSAWSTVGASFGMTASELDQFADAFEHEERARARSG